MARPPEELPKWIRVLREILEEAEEELQCQTPPQTAPKQ